MSIHDPPKHLYVRHEDGPATIGCGSMVDHPRQYTDDPMKASCKRCAKLVDGLSDEIRTEIWQNANDRLDKKSLSPWEREALKKAKKAGKTTSAKAA
jgi:hypothetical protein